MSGEEEIKQEGVAAYAHNNSWQVRHALKYGKPCEIKENPYPEGSQEFAWWAAGAFTEYKRRSDEKRNQHRRIRGLPED